MKMTITMSTENAAIQDNNPFEFRRILHEAIDRATPETIGMRILHDVNGNRVGTIYFQPHEQAKADPNKAHFDSLDLAQSQRMVLQSRTVLR